MIRPFQLANLIGDIPQLLPVRQPYHRTDRQVAPKLHPLRVQGLVSALEDAADRAIPEPTVG
jgi:hypothetical protein